MENSLGEQLRTLVHTLVRISLQVVEVVDNKLLLEDKIVLMGNNHNHSMNLNILD